MKSTRQILGERLKLMRENAELTIEQLAQKMKTSRSQIDSIEKGKKDFTTRYFDRLVQACNTTTESAFAGISTSDIPQKHQSLYWMLGVIVGDGYLNDDERERMIDGISLSLEAISEKALKLKKGARQEKGNLSAHEKKKDQHMLG